MAIAGTLWGGGVLGVVERILSSSSVGTATTLGRTICDDITVNRTTNGCEHHNVTPSRGTQELSGSLEKVERCSQTGGFPMLSGGRVELRSFEKGLADRGGWRQEILPMRHRLRPLFCKLLPMP